MMKKRSTVLWYVLNAYSTPKEKKQRSNNAAQKDYFMNGVFLEHSSNIGMIWYTWRASEAGKPLFA
jgi:hypothetical protein